MNSINIETSYCVRQYTLVNFTQIDNEISRLILSWRNGSEIRKWMYNSDEITLEDHLPFVESLRNRNDCFYWAVYEKSMPVGVVNLTQIDWLSGKAELGYYMRPDYVNSGEGFDFVYSMFVFALDIIKVEYLYGAVHVDNKVPYLLSTFLGSKTIGIKEVGNGDSNRLKFYECYLTPEMFHENEENKGKLVNFVRYIKTNK